MRKPPRYNVWNSEPGPPQASKLGDDGEDAGQREVGAAEQVALAAAAVLPGEQVAARDIAHVDEVDAGVHVGPVAPARDSLHHPPGRRGNAISFADRRGRIDDDSVQAIAR